MEINKINIKVSISDWLDSKATALRIGKFTVHKDGAFTVDDDYPPTIVKKNNEVIGRAFSPKSIQLLIDKNK